MIDLTRSSAQTYSSMLSGGTPSQGSTNSYQTMLADNTPQAKLQESVEQERAAAAAQKQYAMMPAAQNAQSFGTPQSAQGFAPSLGPLPNGSGMSAAEQILNSSWKSMMARNVGRSVIVSFLIGTQNTIVTHGILYEVGSDYIALYQPDERSYISADLYSIRFMEFLPEVSGNQ